MVGVPHRRCGGSPDRVLNHFLYLLPMLLFVQLLQKYLWLPMLLCSVQRKILQTLNQLVSKNILVLISIFLTNKKFPVCFDFQSVIFDCLQVYNNPCQNVLNYKNLIKKYLLHINFFIHSSIRILAKLTSHVESQISIRHILWRFLYAIPIYLIFH